MMKMILKTTIVSILVTLSNGASAQNPVIVQNSSGPSTCDGSAWFTDSTIDFSTLNWSTNGNVIAYGTDFIDSLCSGSYSVSYTSPVSGTFTFTIGSGTPCQNFYTAVTVNPNVNSSVCSGEAEIIVSGGMAPYTYTWSNGATSSVASGLCPGVYSYTVSDMNGCSSSGSATVFDSIYIFNTGNYGGQPIIGYYTQMILDCSLDYGQVVAASVTNISNNNVLQDGLDTLLITWSLLGSNNSVLTTYDLSYIVTDSLNGVIEFELVVYCDQKSAPQSILISDRILYQPLALEENELEFSYVNPVAENLVINLAGSANGEVTLMTSAGQMIASKKFNDSTVLLPVNDLASGVYLVHLAIGGKTCVVRIVK